MNNEDPIISINGINKVYETDTVETHAVSDVSLLVRRGEFIVLTGPSGCGKSTLLGILGLLDKPTSGTYLLNGMDTMAMTYSQLAHARNQTIGFIFQSFNLIGTLSVQENVGMPMIYNRSTSKKERIEKAEYLLEMVGMSHRANHYPSELSGGQQQRVAIARALVNDPAVILADEPTGNLDSRNGAAVMDMLHDIHATGSTICMVTHDSSFAQSAERVIHLLDGRVTSVESQPDHIRWQNNVATV